LAAHFHPARRKSGTGASQQSRREAALPARTDGRSSHSPSPLRTDSTAFTRSMSAVRRRRGVRAPVMPIRGTSASTRAPSRTPYSDKQLRVQS
jgi:hypothetical protein